MGDDNALEAAIQKSETSKDPAIPILLTLQSGSLKPRALADHVPRPGYPLYSSILSHTPELQCFRRFGEVRMRILLTKQDDVTLLEQELFEVDRVEKATLFLGSKRLDKNEKRREVLKKLDTALTDYEKGSISRGEVKYVDQNDLMNIGAISREKGGFDLATEKLIGWLYALYTQIHPNARGSNDNVVRVANHRVRVATRALAAVFTVIVLLVPIIILNAVHGMVGRFVIIFVASSLFVSLLSLGTYTGTTEVFAAGAAYAAIMVVFVSGNGVSG